MQVHILSVKLQVTEKQDVGAYTTRTQVLSTSLAALLSMLAHPRAGTSWW